MQRPMNNGSSGTTFELLVGLTAIGASALTVLALTIRRPPREADKEPKPKVEDADD
jgi:hypothetical protein